MVFIEIVKFFKKFRPYLLIYIIISFLFFINTDFSSQNINNFNFMLVIIITFDIFSYIVGSYLGYTKIFKA